MRKCLAAVVLAFGTVVVSHATPLVPGSTVAGSTLAYGGTQIAFFSSTIPDAVMTVNYTAAVYTDPDNVYCAGCLDFVYSLDNVGTTGLGFLTDFFVSSFGDFETNVGYMGTGVPPALIYREFDGVIDFNFTFPGILQNEVSPFLVIQTDALSFNMGGVDGNLEGFEPIPEPSTIVLLGSGLVGLTAATKRKLLA